MPDIRPARSLMASKRHCEVSSIPPGSMWWIGLLFSCSEWLAIDSFVQRRAGLVGSHLTSSSRTVTNRQSWPFGIDGVAPHSSILPAYQAGAGGNPARVAGATQDAGSLARPART